MALVAAALRRYPYGGVAHGSPARVMQYLVPSICLLAGVGAAALLARIGSGFGSSGADCARPARPGRASGSSRWRSTLRTRIARSTPSGHAEFARRFWPELARGAVPVCLRWDLGLGGWDSQNLNVAVYLCNQRIYSPGAGRASRPVGMPSRTVRPLRCVLPLLDPGDRAGRRLARRHEGRLSPAAQPKARSSTWPSPGRRQDRAYYIYEFVPIPRVFRLTPGRRGTRRCGRAARGRRRRGCRYAAPGDLDQRGGGGERVGQAPRVGQGDQGVVRPVHDQGRHATRGARSSGRGRVSETPASASARRAMSRARRRGQGSRNRRSITAIAASRS